MNYCDDLIKNALKFGNKRLAYDIETGQGITYKNFLLGVKSLAAGLRARGVGPGDSVAIHLYNSTDAAMVHMAVQYIGACSCWIDALVQPDALEFYVDITKCRLLATHLDLSRVKPVVGMKVDLLSTVDIEIMKKKDAAGAPETPYSFEPNDVCYIYFTSGTTNRPKGVMLTGENHRCFTEICDTFWRPVSSDSKHISYVPFSHGFGTIFLLPLTIRTGSELYIMRAFHPLRVVSAIEQFGITHIYGVPSHYQQLLRYPDPKNTLRNLEMAFCAAAKLEHELMLSWADATDTILCEGYGLIETCCGVVWRVGTPSLGTGHMGPLPDRELVEIDILDKHFRPVERGERGQIAVRGRSVMKGYLENSKETDLAIKNGWFLTGDEGYISSDNQLFMTGRIKDIINIAGIKVSPYEVESVLLEHPDVAEVAVVAVPDPLYGEVVKAYVRPEPGIEPVERALIQFASSHLINFQVPKHIEFIDKFPLNHMGKLDRKALRELNPV